MTSTKPIQVGLIGLGKMGQNHIRVLSMLKGVNIAFVYDADQATAQRVADAFGTATGPSVEVLLATVDAAIICTPTTTHGDYLRLVADYVSNIFIEKPLAHDLGETRALTDIINSRGLKVQVGFIERFNPAVRQLKQILDETERVISVDFMRTNKLSARITDVDVVTDLMIHDIDLALFLNGPVVEVSAHGVTKEGMIEFASALLIHENGRFSRIQASRITEKKIRSIQATCHDMYVDCELVRKELLIHRQSEIQQSDGRPYTISAIEQAIEVRQQEALLTELQVFIQMCRSGKVDGPDEEDALRAAELCEKIKSAVLT